MGETCGSNKGGFDLEECGVSPVFDVSTSGDRAAAIEAATVAIGEGKLVVLPTDTVYGVGADPFNPDGVAGLLAAKGRGREKPPAVLVPSAETVDGLAMNVPSYARRLMERFWPGGLTLIFRAQPSLMWDLGDTNGTVGLRVPDDEIALELLRSSGPMAVSSANRTGEETARTVTEAGFAFGPSVEVYLDGGERSGALASTIIDCTKADPVLLRRGGITPEQLREVLGPIDLLDSTGAPVSETPRADEEAAAEADASTSDESDATHAAQSSTDSRDESAADESAAAAATRAERRTRAVPVTPGAGADVDRSSDATQAMPAGGVGAEPPFEREPVRSAELPGRPGRPTD